MIVSSKRLIDMTECLAVKAEVSLANRQEHGLYHSHSEGVRYGIDSSRRYPKKTLHQVHVR